MDAPRWVYHWELHYTLGCSLPSNSGVVQDLQLNTKTVVSPWRWLLLCAGASQIIPLCNSAFCPRNVKHCIFMGNASSFAAMLIFLLIGNEKVDIHSSIPMKAWCTMQKEPSDQNRNESDRILIIPHASASLQAFAKYVLTWPMAKL